MTPEDESAAVDKIIELARIHRANPYMLVGDHRVPRCTVEMLHRRGVSLAEIDRFVLLVRMIQMLREKDAAYLIEKCGVDPKDNEPGSIEGNTVCHMACLGGTGRDFEVVRLAIRLSPESLHVRNRNGDTPLHKAIYHHMAAELISLMIEAGAPLEVTNKTDRTPCDLAAHYALMYPQNMEGFRSLYAAGGPRTLRYIPRGAVALIVRGYRACGETVRAVLRLKRMKSRVLGCNGRDALGLVARMVWVYRVSGDVWLSEESSEKKITL